MNTLVKDHVATLAWRLNRLCWLVFLALYLPTGVPIMCQSDFEGKKAYRHMRHGQEPERLPSIKGQPTLEPFWAAGFSFARGHFIIQVPYDQYLPMVFQGESCFEGAEMGVSDGYSLGVSLKIAFYNTPGEEINMGLRGFTYGYDFYTGT